MAGVFDETWFILASGPSQVYEDVRAVRGRGTACTVNNMAFMAPWADVIYAADANWWKEYGRRVRTFPGRKVSVSATARNYGAKEIMRVGPPRAQGLGHGVLHRGGNSGYQAINLAFNEGAREIVLLGFDCGHTFGKRHCHEDHPAHKGLGNAEGVDTWRVNFGVLARDLRAEGVRVVNCTRHTTLECFERMTLEDYLGRRLRKADS